MKKLLLHCGLKRKLPANPMKMATFLLCIGATVVSGTIQAQVSSNPEKAAPVDPAREQQKEAYYKKLNIDPNAPAIPLEIDEVPQNVVPQRVDPIDPAREKQKEVYFEKLEKGEITPVVESHEPVETVVDNANLPQGFPVFEDTGNFEADKAAYQIAKDAWIDQNGALYESMEDISVPTKKELEERERIIKNN